MAKVFCVFAPDHILNMYDIIYDLLDVYANEEDAQKAVEIFNAQEKAKSYSDFQGSPAFYEERNVK